MTTQPTGKTETHDTPIRAAHRPLPTPRRPVAKPRSRPESTRIWRYEIDAATAQTLCR